MEIKLKPGKYIVAVSGGVDSMALLDMLAGQTGLELVIAHFEHGIRPDSDDDRLLVQRAAERYGLLFVYEHGALGPDTSEARARNARYDFLRRVQAAQGAVAVITAHHQDDVIETAIINLLRGTGPRGLSALQSNDTLTRPLLHTSKAELLAYAHQRHLKWREDSTNQDDRYLRNHIRHAITPLLSAETRTAFLNYIQQAARQNDEMQQLLQQVEQGHVQSGRIESAWFIQLPYPVSCAVLVDFLRTANVHYDKRAINRLVVFMKTGRLGKRADINKQHYLEIGKNHIILVHRS